MDIDTMEAGREMDALVWQILHGQEPSLITCRWTGDEYQPHAGYPLGHVSPENYSTDTNDAMIAFDWLCERGLARLCNGDGDSCDCDFVPDGRAEILYGQRLQVAGASCDTWPLAICRAALKALAT